MVVDDLHCLINKQIKKLTPLTISRTIVLKLVIGINLCFFIYVNFKYKCFKTNTCLLITGSNS